MVYDNFFKLSPSFCLYNKVVPLGFCDGKLNLGIVNEDLDVIERLQKSASRKNINISFVKISQKKFSEKIGNVFSNNSNSCNENFYKENSNTYEDENEVRILLESLIIKGRSINATDIHIEFGHIRFRVKGVLYNEMVIDSKIESALIQRIKLISKMNVLEKRRCQDGSFVFNDEFNEKVYVRVSSIPAVSFNEIEGRESIVMRLLDEKRIPLKIESLGFDFNMQETMKKLCKMDNGLILICGATGSGKSTTACSMISEITKANKFKKKVISLEDPPEYLIEGVTQVHISPEINMDFDDVLRSVFRQDPDIIFIGEIRDEKTAFIAIQAALTGHLVFATMHAFSVETSKSRFIELGINKEIMNEVLRCVIVQEMNNGKVNGELKILNKEFKYEKFT